MDYRGRRSRLVGVVCFIRVFVMRFLAVRSEVWLGCILEVFFKDIVWFFSCGTLCVVWLLGRYVIWMINVCMEVNLSYKIGCFKLFLRRLDNSCL